jgi:hypothetical protein
MAGDFVAAGVVVNTNTALQNAIDQHRFGLTMSFARR